MYGISLEKEKTGKGMAILTSKYILSLLKLFCKQVVS